MDRDIVPRANEFEHKAKELLNQLVDTWMTKVEEDKRLLQTMMTVSNQFTTHEIVYMKYIEPFFLVTAMVLLVVVFIVFKRGKALKSVQILLITACSLETCAILLIVPLDLVFAHFADPDVPVPYPLCSIYLYLNLNVVDGVLAMSLLIKVVFSINRVISIKYPMTAKLWFTPKNMATVCFITTLVTAGAYIGLTFDNINVTLTDLQDDFWMTGRLSLYKACSAIDIDQSKNAVVILVYVIVLWVIPLLVLISCGVVLVVLLKRRQREQRALNATNNKAYRLSRICSILIINFILLEIPQVISVLLFVYTTFGTENIKEILLLGTIIRVCTKVTHGVNSSVALILYALLSQKFRNDFKSMFCTCKRK